MITSEEIDVTLQQKNSGLGKSYLPEKANLQGKRKFQRSWLDHMSWLQCDSETKLGLEDFNATRCVEHWYFHTK
jgi:hypothetical protein